MNIYLVGSVLNMASLLMIGGSGAMICIKGGHFNLGGEGQVYAGGFLAAILFSIFGRIGMPPVFAIMICFLASGFFSSTVAMISALLKQYKKVDVLLSSFLASGAIIPILDSLIAGPARGQTNNLLATEFVPEQFRFNSILPPSPLNGTVFLSVLICLVLFYVFRKTAFGKELEIYGISSRFALYSGFNEKKINYISICLSGFLHGIVGMFAVAGTYFTCHQGFYSGFGWNSLSVALLSFGNPLLLISSSIVLATINILATQAAMFHNFGFDMGNLLQGVILFFIVMFSTLPEKSMSFLKERKYK